MSDDESIPGWYGKLPTLGDFASRRLSGGFIEPWDVWLGEGLAAQRETLGEAWLDAYLHSPTWRFVLMPGTFAGLESQQALAGVLMPSVDRVGRYFPLTLVAGLAQLPQSAAAIESLLGWLHRLEDLALDALQDDWRIEELDAALAELPPISALAPGPSSPASAAALVELSQALESESSFVAIDGIGGRAELAALLCAALGATAANAWQQATRGKTFWLADNPEHPQFLVSAGLPRRGDFARMFGATGRQPGTVTIF
ncbi:MAG TPA: type VI secretion system-associated protein TagF [Caldimonas sp.]